MFIKKMKDKEKAVEEKHKRKGRRKEGFSYVSQVNIYPLCNYSATDKTAGRHVQSGPLSQKARVTHVRACVVTSTYDSAKTLRACVSHPSFMSSV